MRTLAASRLLFRSSGIPGLIVELEAAESWVAKCTTEKDAVLQKIAQEHGIFPVGAKETAALVIEARATGFAWTTFVVK